MKALPHMTPRAPIVWEGQEGLEPHWAAPSGAPTSRDVSIVRSGGSLHGLARADRETHFGAQSCLNACSVGMTEGSALP